MNIECDVITTICGQALATKTRIVQQDCLTVLIVAAVSQTSPYVTYVILYLILEFKT